MDLLTYLQRIADTLISWPRRNEHLTLMGKARIPSNVVRNRPRKQPIGRAKCRWKDIIKMDLTSVGIVDGSGPESWLLGRFLLRMLI
jgi:hypothetical protein